MKKIISMLLVLAALAILAGCSSDETETTTADEAAGYQQISQEEAKRLMDNESGYIILDVRTDEEFAEGHIPGAVLIPDYEVAERAEAELPDKGQLILVYCRSGNRSKKASDVLVTLGYTNVKEFGGINTWPYDIEK
ncbi:MAG: rhodanese-like domain-containing protein [Lachnospiraceae bacterium]|nr:rhodanese-like domain-containing protein [Lachnospiraceae bacterium]